MDATARKIAIMEIIENGNGVKISELSKSYGVSRETVRRDLSELEAENKLKLVRGGAVPILPKNETPYERRLKSMKAEKESIARSFVERVKDGDTVFLDNGTTCLAVAKQLKNKKLTVVTNSLPIINELYKVDDINVYVLGGFVHKNEGSFVGANAIAALKMLNINLGFFSGSGFDVRAGLSNHNVEESDLTRHVIKRCQKVFVGVDYSKFGNIFSQKILDVDDIDVLITNEVSDEDIKVLKEKVELIISEK